MDKLLTIKEVAKYLRVSERSVNRYIESGRLRASRIGQWRIKEKDLEKFLKENSNDRREEQKAGDQKRLKNTKNKSMR